MCGKQLSINSLNCGKRCKKLNFADLIIAKNTTIKVHCDTFSTCLYVSEMILDHQGIFSKAIICVFKPLVASRFGI